MIEAGTEAPDFTLDDQDGNPVTLSELRGSPVVLYFYPKAETPGCTKQACGVRDNSDRYAERGARVLGVSPDTVPEIAAFAANHGLDFTLLSDPDHRVAEAYGVWGELQVGDRTIPAVTRSTVVIDHDGTIAAALPNIDPEEHDEKVLAALDSLPKAA